ncbi:MAG TPA: hypothetical protein VG056_11055 [Pirellulales bacterium]|nr:hypothetical protein [Pirellulales bacterium]
MNADLNDLDLRDDLTITKTTRRASGAGTWVCGTIAGHRFDALVFPEHAENPEWELDDSRISKLWLQRLADKQTVFDWDRGADVPAADPVVAAIVDFLCAGLADLVYAESPNGFIPPTLRSTTMTNEQLTTLEAQDALVGRRIVEVRHMTSRALVEETPARIRMLYDIEDRGKARAELDRAAARLRLWRCERPGRPGIRPPLRCVKGVTTRPEASALVFCNPAHSVFGEMGPNAAAGAKNVSSAICLQASGGTVD